MIFQNENVEAKKVLEEMKAQLLNWISTFEVSCYSFLYKY